MIKKEEEAIKTLEEIVKEYQKIIDIEDPIERDCVMSCYMEYMPFYQIKTLLKLIKKQQKKIEDNKKFKKDIVSKIMIWDKEGLPKDEVVIRMIDTLMEEVSRLEDIEDKKVEVAVDFIEEKRDKYWKDKIREKIKKYQEKAEDVKQKYKGVYAYKDDYLEALAKIEGYQELLEEN